MSEYVLPHPVRNSFKAFVEQHTLLVFFVLVFALTWPFLIMDALGSHNLLPFRLPVPLLILTGYQPALAAIIVTGVLSGKSGIQDLFRKLLVWRVGGRWYATAIFGYAVLCMVTVALAAMPDGVSNLSILSPEIANFGPSEMIINVTILFIITGLVNGEEIAWRGFALPRLQAKWNALQSGVILGVIWALFHLPLFLTLTGSSQTGQNPWAFLLGTIGLSIIFTWLYNNTRGSLLLAYMLHAAVNTWTRVFPIDHGGPQISWILTGITCLVAIILVLAYGPTRLSRKTLEE